MKTEEIEWNEKNKAILRQSHASQFTKLLDGRKQPTYLELSLLPWFLATTLVSAFSGHMLEYWSPEKVSVNGTTIPLQLAMIHNQVPFWHSPAAMRLMLGGCALGGRIIAALLRDWLTQPRLHIISDTHVGDDGDGCLHGLVSSFQLYCSPEAGLAPIPRQIIQIVALVVMGRKKPEAQV